MTRLTQRQELARRAPLEARRARLEARAACTRLEIGWPAHGQRKGDLRRRLGRMASGERSNGAEARME